MSQDIVRVLRLIEYEGPRDLVEAQLKNSLQGTRMGITRKGRLDYMGLGAPSTNSVRITAITLGTYPDIIEPARVYILCPACAAGNHDDTECNTVCKDYKCSCPCRHKEQRP